MQQTNTTLLINFENGDVSKLETQSMLESAANKVTKSFKAYQVRNRKVKWLSLQFF